MPAKKSERSIGAGEGNALAPRMLKEFRQFILRGNLVDLAVAVVVGAAFGGRRHRPGRRHHHAAHRRGRRQAGLLRPDVHHQRQRFRYGDFFNALLRFLIVAAVVFFLVIKPVNALLERLQTETPSTGRPASARSA